ncbi:MAG TPA: ABC transporter ATP-binding protein [Longimicrobiales bacterium]|nr:ABC transporter ATP-binding protein [Longimicrobiales bacterium]
MADDARAVVRASRLVRRFGDFTAVDDVSFDVTRGEIFGFLGPNGAGKTTTIRMLTGLLQPTSGTVRVADHDGASARSVLRERIGYMSQVFSLYGDLTVGENIELFAGLYGVTGTRYRDGRARVLELSGLAGRDRTLTAELPLGFKQRLALGCAVLHEPAALFLDEPTSGVDPAARRAFWDLIHALADGGTTTLVSTHYMEEAEYCDRLILMNRGRIVAEGTPRELRAGMDRPIYEVDTDDAPLAVEVLTAAADIEDASLFGRSVHVVPARDDGDGAAVRGVLEGAGRPVRGLRRVSPTLEDVFVALVRREGGAVEG